MTEELHIRAQKGDQSAFREIVDKHQVMVRSITRKFSFNKEDAEDIAQIVFLEVFNNIHVFKGNAKLSTWIYRIALTRCIDFNRRENRRAKIMQIKDFFSLTGHEKEYKDGRNTPDTESIANEQKAILYRALNRLPENQRSAILLSKVEGFSQQEIAETLGTSVPAVESLLHRAKSNLRKYLAKDYTTD